MKRLRTLGTMIAYGFPRGHLERDLAIALELGAEVIEVLPDWRALPDPLTLRTRVEDAGFRVHSSHGCWGAQAIQAARVDLADLNLSARRASIDDAKRCLDWTRTAGGAHTILHPGGLSDAAEQEARSEALTESLEALADHVRGSAGTICVENMPPGVHPGSSMSDLFRIVSELGRPEVALALDTGHGNLVSTAETETRAAGILLQTTHVHDNDGRADAHLPPGAGTIDWDAWRHSLDEIGYEGPVMLECIRHLRERPDSLNDRLLNQVRRLVAT